MWLHSAIALAVLAVASALFLKFAPLPWCWIWLMLAAGMIALLRLQRKHPGKRWKLICINLIPICIFMSGAEWFFSRLEGGVTTWQDAEAVGSDPVLGSAPIPGAANHFRMSSQGREIASGEITIDRLGNRITPVSPADGGSTVFYGCSFTFGLGLSDHETLPWQFAQATGRPVFNLALNGYGPQQLLAMLESGRFSERVEQSPELVIYLALPCHLERLNGEPSFSANSPRYRLKNGELRRDGTFLPFDGIPLLGVSARQLFKSPVFSRLYSALRRSSLNDRERRELFRAAVLKMDELLAQQAPNARFVVLNYDSPDDTVGECLAGLPVTVIRCSELTDKDLEDPGYHIPVDGHPSGTLWREMMPGILRTLEIEPRTD